MKTRAGRQKEPGPSKAQPSGNCGANNISPHSAHATQMAAPSGAKLWAGAGRGGSVLCFQVMGCAQALVSLYLSYRIIYPHDSQCEGTKRNLAKWLSHPCLPVPQVFFPRDINVTHFAPVCMSTCYAKRSLDQKHHHGLGVRNAHSQAGIRIGILTHSKGI